MQSKTAVQDRSPRPLPSSDACIHAFVERKLASALIEVARLAVENVLGEREHVEGAVLQLGLVAARILEELEMRERLEPLRRKTPSAGGVATTDR